jgi:hypothetical protein
MNKKNTNNYFDDEDANLGFVNFENANDRQYNSMLPKNKKGLK